MNGALLFDEDESARHLLPFALDGKFDGAAFALLEDECAVGLGRECGFEVFAAIVVGHQECGRVVVFEGYVGENPFAAV